MKKNLLLAVLCLGAAALKAQNGNVGFNQTNPQANLHATGTLRLEHSSMGDGRVIYIHPSGYANWGIPFTDSKVDGVSTSGTPSWAGDGPTSTGSYITLPPGKFLVHCSYAIGLPGNASPGTNQGLTVNLYFSDSAASSTPTADYAAGYSTTMSGNLKGNGTYSMIDGNVVINNTSGANKTYYIYATKTGYGNLTTPPFRITAAYWSERNFYAYQIQ